MPHTDREYYEKAKKLVKKKKDYKNSLRSFIITMPILIVINLMTSRDFLWFFFPMIGWGSGLVASYYDIYVKPEKKSWEDHEIQKEMERLRQRDRKFVERDFDKDDFDDRLDLREIRTNYDERDFV